MVFKVAIKVLLLLKNQNKVSELQIYVEDLWLDL